MKKGKLWRTVILLLLLPFLWQCNTPEKSTLCYLKTYSRNDGSQTESVTFTYEGSLVMSEARTVSGTTAVSVYDYDGRSNRIKSTTQSPSGNYTTSYSYDNQNKLVAAVSVGTDWTLTLQYMYNDNGQLVKETSNYTSGAGDDVEVRTYAYPDVLTKNPSQVTLESDGTSTWVESLEYDDKINPMRSFLSSIRAANNIERNEA